MIQKATEKAMPKMYVIPDILYAKQAKEEKIRTEKTGWLQEACRVGRAEKRGEGEKSVNFKANPLRGPTKILQQQFHPRRPIGSFWA